MLLSIGIIFILGYFLGKFIERWNLPSLIGYLFIGIVLGPNVLNILDEKLLLISEELRLMILVIILTRGGLSLDLFDLKKVGLQAFMLSFVPAVFEILGTIILAPRIFGISRIEAALLGSVLAAVSPAVVVPRMINLIMNGYGEKKPVPQMVLAGSSIDDIFAIVVFTSILGIMTGEGFSPMSVVSLPVSIVVGLFVGYILARPTLGLIKMPEKNIQKVFMYLSVGFLILTVEDYLPIPMSGLLAIMAIGITINRIDRKVSEELSESFNDVWIIGEKFLFVLVGAQVDISYAMSFGMLPVVLIVSVLIFRGVGVLIATSGAGLNMKEKIFVLISYLPKATVQAAIGGIPLAVGLDSGMLILTLAVVSILLTAPVGAILIDNLYDKLLTYK